MARKCLTQSIQPKARKAKISLIWYIDQDSGYEGQRLREAVCPFFTPIPQVSCADLKTLLIRVRRPVRYGDLNIYVLLADTVDRLTRLAAYGDVFEDRKVVLILPDNQKGTYALGFQMYPRFVTLMPGGYDDLCAVVAEMVHPKKPA